VRSQLRGAGTMLGGVAFVIHSFDEDLPCRGGHETRLTRPLRFAAEGPSSNPLHAQLNCDGCWRALAGASGPSSDLARTFLPTQGCAERPMVPVMSEAEGPHGVLSPNGDGIWHMVPWALAPEAVCGRIIEYGARLRTWAETPPEHRCEICLRRYSGELV